MARRNSTLGRSVLDLDIDDSAFHSKLSGAARAASKFTDSAGTGLMKAGKAISGVGDSMTRNVTLPILAAGGAVAKLGLDFDTTGRQLVGLTDVTGAELDGIKEKILALGPAVGKGPQELAEAFYFIASAGFKADEAMEVLETSAKAAASGLGETQTIAQVLGGVINAYGRENITAARAADILTEAVSQGTAEASGLANVIGNVVPGAAALGVSFDQVTAAMAGMTLTGVGVEESATSLIQIFSSLQKPAVGAEEALEGLGLSSAELRRQLREEGLLATLRTLEERFAGNETAAAAVFGNIRALRGVTALLTLDSDQLSAVFEKVADSTGRMNQAYDETEGPQREIDRNMAKLQASAIELGTDVLPLVVEVLGQVADAVGGLAAWWKTLDKGTKDLIISSLAWLAIAGPTLMVVGKLTSGLGALLKVVGFLGGAKGLAGLPKLISLSRIAMFGWVGAITLVTIGLDKALDAAAGFFRELQLGKKGAKTLESLAELVGNGAFATQLFAWGVSVEDFTNVLELAEGDADAAFRAIQDAAGDVGLAMAVLSGGFEDAAGAGGAMSGRLRDQVQANLRAIARDAEQLPVELAAALVDGQFVVGEAAEVTVDPIDQALLEAVASAGDRGKEIIDALAGSLADGPDQLKDELKALRDALINPYTEVEREADLQSALANAAIAKNLKTGDKQSEALAAQQVENWLDQYRLLEPGAFEAGLTVPPALQSGVDRNLDATVQWMQDNVTGPIADKFDLAAVLEAMGYDGLAAYVRGQERARIDKLQTQAGLILRDTKIAFMDDFWQEGRDAMATYAAGLAAGAEQAITVARNLVGRVGRLLRFAGSPDYTYSREAGEGVGESYMQALIHAIANIRALESGVGAIGDALALTPRIGMPAMPGLAGMGADTGLRTSAIPSGGTVINNTWTLTVNGVPYTFETRDDFIGALDDLSAFSEGRLQ